VYVGKDDSIVRKGEFDLSANLLGTTANLGVDTEITGVNDPQTISAPSGAKPIEELRGQLPPEARGAFDCFLNAEDATAATACAQQLQGRATPSVGGLSL
jgi:hypothetical protein